MGDNRPPVYKENDTWVIRASSLGACTRRLIQHGLGMEGQPTPQSIIDAWKFGTEHEQIVIDRLEKEGKYRVLSQQELRQYGTVDSTGQLRGELKIKGGEIIIRCHPDGIVEDVETGERFVLEVKCMAEGNPPWDKEFYTWQTSVEAAVTKLPILMVVGWKVPGEGGEQRVLKDGPPEVREYPVRYKLGQIKARALKVIRDVEKGDVPDVCDNNDYPCPFYLTHPDQGDVDDWVEVEEDADVIANLAREMQMWDAEKKKAEKQYKAARDELKSKLKQGKWKAGGWNVMVTTTHHEAKTVERKAYDATTIKVEKEKS